MSIFTQPPVYALALALSFQAHYEERWPTIRPLSESHRFVVATVDTSDLALVTFVKNPAGVSIYELECHNRNYNDTSEIDFSGDFQCALFGLHGGKVATGNLLATKGRDEASTDWWNRGRMLARQLRPDGPCAGYPEYGTVRHFKLRGMLITLQFSDLVWREVAGTRSAELKNFSFTVSVTPDESATTQVAAKISGPRPPAACY